MTASQTPQIGEWYQYPSGESFEVVAINEQGGTVQVQHYDGTIEELDLFAWDMRDTVPAAPPDNWSGSLDMDPQEFKEGDEPNLDEEWLDDIADFEQNE